MIDNAKIKNLLKKYNLKPNFTYGQNFLMDEDVLDEMVEAAGVGKEDTVLEVGPGIGNLTRKLCERAGIVLSVEKDPHFLPILKSIKKDFPNFHWEIADVLEYDFIKYIESSGEMNPSRSTLLSPRERMRGEGAELTPVNPSYKVVANIPYYVTGKILQLLLASPKKPKSITVLIQKEVAENVVAGPGDLNILAISVQLYGAPKIIQIVPAESFYPAPKVDSAVLQIDLYQEPRYDIGDEKKFFRVIKSCFAGKRKQLHNTLVNNLKIPKEKALEILSSLHIDPTTRPQELSIDQWGELSKLL